MNDTNTTTETRQVNEPRVDNDMVRDLVNAAASALNGPSAASAAAQVLVAFAECGILHPLHEARLEAAAASERIAFLVRQCDEKERLRIEATMDNATREAIAELRYVMFMSEETDLQQVAEHAAKTIRRLLAKEPPPAQACYEARIAGPLNSLAESVGLAPGGKIEDVPGMACDQLASLRQQVAAREQLRMLDRFKHNKLISAVLTFCRGGSVLNDIDESVHSELSAVLDFGVLLRQELGLCADPVPGKFAGRDEVLSAIRKLKAAAVPTTAADQIKPFKIGQIVYMGPSACKVIDVKNPQPCYEIEAMDPAQETSYRFHALHQDIEVRA